MVWVVRLISNRKESQDLMIPRDSHTANVDFVPVITAKGNDFIFKLSSKLHAQIHLCCTMVDMVVDMCRRLTPFL